MKNKLYKLSITLTKDGFKEQLTGWDIIKEGDKTYNVERTDKWGDTIRKFKKKKDIGIVDTGTYYNSNSEISFGAWCFDEDFDRMREKINELIVKTATSYLNAVSELVAHIK